MREDLMSNGLDVLMDVKGVGIITAFSLTTSLSATRLDRVLSESMARDQIDLEIRTDLLDFLGTWGKRDLIPQVKSRVLTRLKLLERRGVLTSGIDERGAILPAYTPPSVGLQAGLLTVVWNALIGGEVDQIGVLGLLGYQRFEIVLSTAATPALAA
jgi:hypothetical protein